MYNLIFNYSTVSHLYRIHTETYQYKPSISSLYLCQYMIHHNVIYLRRRSSIYLYILVHYYNYIPIVRSARAGLTKISQEIEETHHTCKKHSKKAQVLMHESPRNLLKLHFSMLSNPSSLRVRPHIVEYYANASDIV